MEIKDLEQKIIKRLEEAAENSLGEKPENIRLIFPPEPKLGDFTFECFSLAKKLKKTPVEIASAISSEIKPDEIIAEINATGPYVNMKLDNGALFSVVEKVNSQKDNFGNSLIGKDEKVMIEYLGPNTNKPLHLGHARNGSLGMALSNILEKTGHKVLKANLINDRGIHISKSMLAYQKWGEDSTPESMKMKGDHFVGHWYVCYNEELKNNPDLDNEIKEMLKKWESGDKETLELWKKMNNWVYEGWKETYEELGFEFDKVNYESETYKLGKEVVEKGLEKGIFEKSTDGSIIFNLTEKEFGLDKEGKPKKITLVRADGTSVYITQDIGTAVSRFEESDLTRLIYIVGSEQDYHFRCLFKILDSLGYPWAKNLYHLSYGMITLPEGKMKSREGKVVDADDLISEVRELASKEVRKRFEKEKISEEEITERAKKIGTGAIKFYFLRVNPKEEVEFNPKESVSFDGFTGPYCQYAYARIASILRKSGVDNFGEVDYSVLGNNLEERELIQKIIQFPEKIEKASLERNPSIIALYIFETAQLFNKFYQKHKVLNAETEELKNSRLSLIQAIQILLKVGLNLLGIETLGKM
jgi:arginyl-tRNA synthetase